MSRENKLFILTMIVVLAGFAGFFYCFGHADDGKVLNEPYRQLNSLPVESSSQPGTAIRHAP